MITTQHYTTKIGISGLLITLVLMMNACTTGLKQSAQVHHKNPADQVTQKVIGKPEVKLPKIDLTADILYKMLVAEIAGQRNQLPISVAHYLNLARTTRDPRIVARATHVAVYAGDNAAARDLAQLWLEINAEDPDAHQMLAMLAVKEGDINKALEHFKIIFKQNVPEISLDQQLWSIVNLFVAEQDKQQLKSILHALVAEHQQDAQVLFAYAQILVHLSELSDAHTVLEQVLMLQPENENATIAYVTVLNQLEQHEEALLWLEQALKQSKDDFNLRVFYARVLTDLQRFDEAQQQFEALQKKAPDEPNVLFSLGLLYLKASKLDEAEACFLGLSGIKDHLDDANYYLGRIAEQKGSLDKAVAWYQGVAGGYNYFEAQIRTGLLLGQQNKLVEAQTHLWNIHAQNEQQRDILIQIEAEILFDAKRYHEAMLVYDKVLKDSHDEDLFYSRAMLAEKIGDLDVLERDLLAILEKDPNNSRALNALGYTLADRTNRYDEAYKFIKQALELSPNDYHILDSMGWVLYQQGQLDEAIEFLNRALAQKSDPEVAAHLGEVLWIKGDKEAARAIWDVGLEQDPTYEKLHEVINRFNQ